MSEWNNLEHQLTSWIPRRPSPKLSARLFPGAVGADGGLMAVRAATPAAWNWLAPAMAVFLFGMFLAGRHPYGWSDLAGSQMASVAMSDPDMAAYSDASHHSVANTPPAAKFASAPALGTIFAWTKSGGSLTTALPMLNTNSPLP